MKEFYRHGDVCIEKLPQKIDHAFKKKKDTILLEGEATNHFHRLHGGVVYENPTNDSQNYLLGIFDLVKPTPLTHEEHKTIELQPGQYKFHVQREYDPIQERRVAD